jgi:hypothetical protein
MIPHPIRQSTMFIVVLTIMFLWTSTSPISSTVSAFEFQHDADSEQCAKDVEMCTKNSTMWFKCPISCSKSLEQEGYMAEERDDPDKFFQMDIVTKPKGKITSLEGNEGYLTLFAVVPLLPGMAQYYYEAIEHIAQVYKYTLVPMVLPYQVSTTDLEDNDAQEIKVIPNAKVILLETGESSRLVLDYLLQRPVVAGNYQLTGNLDRPTIFLVSHTGMYIERIVSPSMESLERRIKVHEQSMSAKEL